MDSFTYISSYHNHKFVCNLAMFVHKKEKCKNFLKEGVEGGVGVGVGGSSRDGGQV